MKSQHQSDLWATCPFCGKRLFAITPGATIKASFQCKASKCKALFTVNTQTGEGIRKFPAK